VSFPGLSINGFTNSSNSGIVFATLKPFDERKQRRPERRRHRRPAERVLSAASRTRSS
jgi:multidrug efflux pump subunit AcrB